jgi:Cu/Ag efflux protein CusF
MVKAYLTLAVLVAVTATAHAAEGRYPQAPAATSVTAAAELPMTDAEVRKIDVKAGKLTLRHQRLENLDMAPMTMVFGVQDPAWLSTLKVGDKVRVAVERVDGTLTVVALEPAK